MTQAEIAQQILDNLKSRKGTEQEGKLSVADINLLKRIASI
jgi:hypothetical protein